MNTLFGIVLGLAIVALPFIAAYKIKDRKW